MPDGYVLSERDRNDLRQLIRKMVAEERRRAERSQSVVNHATHIREGVLDAQLVAGNNTGVAMSVYTGTAGNWNDSTENITVKWPSGKGVTINSGLYVIVAQINGEWRPIASEC